MRAWRGKRLAIYFSVIFSLSGCYETSLHGQSDSEVDVEADDAMEADDRVETVDGVDADDGDGVDDTGPDAACPDNDSDGFRDEACGGRDCDDTRNDVSPGAEEVCLDGIDNDCDGLVDGPMLMLADDLPLSGATGSAGSPGLLWTGSEFVAIWPHLSPEGSEARMARISASGDRVERETMVLEEDHNIHEPSLAWTGSEIGIAWERSSGEYPEVYFTLLSAAGDRLMEDVRVTYDEWMSVSPHIAWTGSEFAIAWVDTRLTESPCSMMGCSYDIYFARVSAEGVKTGDDIRVSDTAVTGRGYWGPVWISRAGSELGIFWNMFSRLNLAGLEAGPDMFLGHEREGLPAWTGSEYGLLWASWMSDPVDRQGVYFTRRGPTGEERGRTLVEAMEYSNDEFSIAWADGRFGVLWYASEEDGSSIYFRSLTANGELEGIKIKIAGTLAHISHHGLAWSGSELGVAWSENRESSRNAFFNRIGFCE